MRVLVCGGRDYSDRQTVFDYLDGLHLLHTITLLIHGGARGADWLAGQWGQDRSVPVTVFAADWFNHGKAAGPLRNAKMLAEGKPDLVVAFPGGRGTTDMVRKANAAGVRVVQPTKEGS